ncbi:MAG: delta-lactam-biosynthetic de-N-acetylase [Clostridiales bacterium]|nr:delta-lactam-biosynthetic de-N-acetylase [Clostridiales bacterium]MCF8022967.1 delta-lactam-biosynthetic de-N-acetylase [Clostridiales bacterium]
MRKHLITFLAISIVLNLCLAGTSFFTSAGNYSNDIEKQDTTQLEQLKIRIEQLKKEKQLLKERLDKLQSATPLETDDDKIYNWYFMRKEGHTPPTTEPLYLEMIKNRGHFLGDTNKKKIFLTFDEGYENGYTVKILNTLKNNNVQAAFFVTGSYVKKNPELVKRMADEGHIIGNHSNTHPSMPQLSDKEIKQELSTVSSMVEDLTGNGTHFFRPPRGQFNSRVLKLADEQGYSTIFWSMAYRDWITDDQPGEETAYNFVTDNIHNGAVILLHAVSQSNAAALDNIIKELKKQGYSFASLNHI